MKLWMLRLGFLPLVAADFGNWSLVLLEEAVQTRGAACLDGSPAGYWIEHGWGSGAKRWIIHFQGGGWCISYEDCLARSKTSLGSSLNFTAEKSKTLEYSDGGVHGYLSNQPEVNPDFYNWNKVFALYCDGSSRNSEVEGPVVVGQKEVLYFRGHRILMATMESLMETMGQGTGLATDLIVGGCSAGGLTVWLHLDYIRRLMPSSVRVVGLPQCGLFMDQPDYQGLEYFTPLYAHIFDMMGMIRSPSLDPGCLDKYSEEPWHCFMAQYVMPFVQTPYFAVNSFYDSERNLKDIMVKNVSQSAGSHSYFLYSCVSHCGYLNHDDGWRRLVVNGQSLRGAISAWYFHERIFQGAQVQEMPDENPTCHPYGIEIVV
ncbi:unnamed protein product [Durusdinium trenchii]|uniref:Pectin acetylesterase n=1 Tax=Durusdinium trenchii TaxID=1381693 RepID=A0ABP0M265_9DINO